MSTCLDKYSLMRPNSEFFNCSRPWRVQTVRRPVSALDVMPHFHFLFAAPTDADVTLAHSFLHVCVCNIPGLFYAFRLPDPGGRIRGAGNDTLEAAHSERVGGWE